MTNDIPETETTDDEFSAALESVRNAIDRFARCSPEERELLEKELDDLRSMEQKLSAGRVEIVVFGEISAGKSALINALVGEAVALVNVRGGWTKDIWHVPWSAAGHCVPGFAESQVVLVDTPGLNEVDGGDRAEMARQATERADLTIFVTDSDLTDSEYSALLELASNHKPIILALNKSDLYSQEQLDQLLEGFHGMRLEGIVERENIVITCADPKEVEYVIESADGSTRKEWRKPVPDVEDLKVRILEVLEADGKSLVLLNAALFTADKSDRMGAIRVRMRNDRANKTIWTYAVMKSLAVSLNPSAVFDVLGGSAVDAAMIVTLGKVYGIEITTANAGGLVTSILKAAGWVMLGEAVVSYGSSFFKGVSGGLSTAVTALPQGAAAGYGSYIVGQAARYYFEHGASWGAQGPKQVISQILDNTDKRSVIDNLKQEIKRKLSSNKHVE